MADNFNMKTFLAENKLGAYARLKEEKENVNIELYQGTVLTGPKENEDKVKELAKEIEQAMKTAFEAAKGTGSESQAMDDRDDTVYEYEDKLSELGFKIDEDLEESSSKTKEEQFGGVNEMDTEKTVETNDMNEASNPEGDKLVMRFLQGIAKKFDYGVSDAARFVKETIKRLGYTESKEEKEEAFGGINEASEDEVPLTPKVKKFIDKAIADAKTDGEFENLVKADWFNNELIDELIDLFEDEDYDSASKEVKDYISKAISVKESQMNEALEPHVFERMANLSNIKAQQAMIKSAEIMMNELTAEGFEVEEIREFFTQLIANDI